MPHARRIRVNPSGVSRRQVCTTVAIGVVVGVVGGLLLRRLLEYDASAERVALPILVGVVGGATLGAGGVLLVARLLDRWRPWGDPLLGYSGMTRLLWHAGELSFLGAMAGGIGAGFGGVAGSAMAGAIVGLLLGGVLYRVRGMGAALGASAGLVAGVLGGLLGGLADWLW